MAGIFTAGGAGAGSDATPQQQLEDVQKALAEASARQAALAKEADELAAEITSLRDQSVAAAQAEQHHEQDLSQLDARLAALTVEERRETAELLRQHSQEAGLLMALVRLARNPPEGLVLVPGEPVDVLRGGLLMAAAVPPIESRAQILRAELAGVAAVRREIAETRETYRADHEQLVASQQQLAAIIAKKSGLQKHAAKGAAEAAQRQAQLAAQAQDLHDLIEQLDRAPPASAPPPQPTPTASATPAIIDPNLRSNHALEVVAPRAVIIDPDRPRKIRPFSEARGEMVFPATGTLLRRYGEADDVGVSAKGLTVETRPGAQVVAPFDGRVVFAGPFKGYGQILIIGHGDGYHSLVAGLDQVDGTVGQWLVAGEPIGVMAASGRPHLYLELRHNNQPVNPMPWLSHRDEKVSG